MNTRPFPGNSKIASGGLPIALGEATKTVPFVMDGRKRYRFMVRWGEERDTDDAEGVVVATSAQRPEAAAIRAAIGSFIGTIAQVPPAFSAIKVDGDVVDADDVRAVVRADGRTPVAAAPTAPTSAPAPGAPRPATLREFKEVSEREFLVEKLREFGWNISKTAEAIVCG